MLIDLQSGLLISLLPSHPYNDKTDQNSHKKDDKENDDQGDADAERVGCSRNAGDTVYTSSQDATMMNDPIEDSARTVQRLNFAVDGEVGQASFEFCNARSENT